MPYLDDVLNPYQSLTGDLTPEDTLTGLLSEDGLLQGAIAISDVVGVTELTELTDVSITNPLNNDVLTYNDVTEKWENMPAQGGGGGTSDYEDLDNKPSINSVTLTGNQTTDTLGLFSGDYDDLTNKPELATVATTGNYNDLSNRPTIPAAQVNADWDAVSGVEEILNKPNLATVATSGDYDDLINKPTYEDFTSSATFNATPGSDTHFYKEGNIVYLYFQSASGTHATDEQLFTLPSGYRPLASLDGTFILNNSAYGVININAGTGVCKINFISSTTANGRVYCNIAYPVA